MKKTKELDVVLAEIDATPIKKGIDLLDFTDLNTIKDKLNEVITYLNR